MASVDVIIVNWNAGKQLRECLAALSESIQTGYTISSVIVVDNASVDGSDANLDFPLLPLRLIRNAGNRGFAAACNQGVDASQADYFLFLNPDSRVNKTTLGNSIRFMEEKENARVGICGVQLVDKAGTVACSCAHFLRSRYFIYAMLGLNRLFPTVCPDLVYPEKAHLQSHQVEHVIGAYFFVRSSLFKDLAGFDERFFVYYEDVDFSFRAYKAGWSSYYLADTRCYHAGGGTSAQVKAKRLFYSLRSRTLYGFKHFRLSNAFFLLAATLLMEPISRLLLALFSGSLTQAQETLVAYWLFGKSIPGLFSNPYLTSTGLVKQELTDGASIQIHLS